MSDSMFHWIGFRADSEGSAPGFYAMAFRTGVVAVVGSGIYCYGLAYESQQEPARQRGLLKAQKIRERLGSNASMLDDFPNKPRGMHWRTYDRPQRRYEAADAQSLMTLTEFVDRYAAR